MLRHTREPTTSDLYVHVFESVRRGTADRMDGVLRRVLHRLLHHDLDGPMKRPRAGRKWLVAGLPDLRARRDSNP